MKIGRKIAKHAILPSSRSPINHQHARRGAIVERLLGDPFFRKTVVKVAEAQFFTIICFGSLPRG